MSGPEARKFGANSFRVQPNKTARVPINTGADYM
jgi:hypothetical protein